jgi:predicted DNA-binding transcriptional regulator YafY
MSARRSTVRFPPGQHSLMAQPQTVIIAVDDELLDEVFARKRDFSITKYAERSFGVFQEKPVDVVWKFTPKAAEDASEFLFHPNQETERLKDGSLVVRFCAGGLLEMAWHLFTWGNEVEIIKPKRLASMLREQSETQAAHLARTAS